MLLMFKFQSEEVSSFLTFNFQVLAIFIICQIFNHLRHFMSSFMQCAKNFRLIRVMSLHFISFKTNS